MSEAAKIARGGAKGQVKESRIARGANQSPEGNLGKLARKGGEIPLNPNAKHDPRGVGTH